MLTPADLHPYQKRAIMHGCDLPQSMHWLFMSAGKTVITLTILRHLRRLWRVSGCLVIAPKLVAETVWRQETQHWSHLRDMRGLLLRGKWPTVVRDLLRDDVDFHIVNYEMLPKLVKHINATFLAKGKYPPWNMVVFDEVDRFKDPSGKRFQWFEGLLPWLPYRIGMTGTPGDNGYLDLFGQYLMVDGGKRLGQHITDYRNRFFKEGYAGQSWSLLPGAKEQIEERIGDITLSMSAEDYLDLPDYQFHDHWVDMDSKTQASYDTLEEEFLAAFERHAEEWHLDPDEGDPDEWELGAVNTISLRTKLQQVANGVVLDAEKAPRKVHDAKLEMLDRIVHEANGSPIFLAYLYRADLARIQERYCKHGLRIGYIGPGVKDVENVIAQWNAGALHMLAAHPQSAGHGLNLQRGGHEIVWFGLTDNLRLYRQFNARLRRMGQAAPNVHVRRILARNTIDEVISDLLETKFETAEGLRRSVEAYRRRKGL